MFDIAGTLVLFAVVLLFGFLTTRAWRLKNGLLRWGGTALGALVTLIPTALLGLALAGYAKLNQHYANVAADVHVARTAAQIARGQKLAYICASCHAPGEQQLPLSGANFVQKFNFPPMGTLYAPNLTPAGEINDWTDGEIIRAIREGVHKNGRSLLIMPADNFRNLSDDDVQALVAYLRSQPATGQRSPANQFNILGAIFTNLVDLRTAQQPVSSVPVPQPGTPEYGKYMVDIIGCRSCHGAQLQGRADNGQPGPPAGPNLTKIVPGWTEAQFMHFFNTGQLPDGSEIGYNMPWQEVRAVARDDELQSIYSYLHALPPVDGPNQ
jgi:cytochrome c553